jgi:hypothetical protein
MINLYFLHLDTNYEDPYNARNFKMIHFYCGSFEIFTNPPNLIKNLMVSSLQKIKGKNLDH